MEKQEFTITVYTENQVGLLHRITTTFTKRKINLESLTTSESEIPGIHRFTIAVTETEEQVVKVVKQIEKQVDVIKAFYHTDEETIFQESALYKVKSSALFEERHIQNIIKESHANIVTGPPELFAIENTGFRSETDRLYQDLAPFGLLQFVRSGRISITKSKMGISEILKKFKSDK